jgi:hypothetical protein
MWCRCAAQVCVWSALTWAGGCTGAAACKVAGIANLHIGLLFCFQQRPLLCCAVLCSDGIPLVLSYLGPRCSHWICAGHCEQGGGHPGGVTAH